MDTGDLDGVDKNNSRMHSSGSSSPSCLRKNKNLIRVRRS